MIYLDSSALLKLLVEEAESEALAAWLAEHTEGRGGAGGAAAASSELARVEVVRAVRRLNPQAVASARTLVAQLDLVPLSREVVDRAADLGDPGLRSLDALHLASALVLGDDLDVLVVYDRRLSAAAQDAGLTVVQPGVA